MRILVVGSLEPAVTSAIRIAQDHGATVTHATDNHAALQTLLAGKSADLILVDTRGDIAGLIAELEESRINAQVAAYGINTDGRTAANAIKAGAKEYVPFPPDSDLIAAILEAAAEESKDLIFKSEAMRQCVALADQVAPANASILITGESGTGKEVIARYIHDKSKRAQAPFVSVNCAAIPDNLLESEMFGHEKGAFTGATGRRIGRFEEANGGTLLLDEISEMDLRLQAKLLRAIQEREIDRLGGNTSVKVDIRILATSNRDLAEEVKKGTFREDLYFRLNVIHLQLPPLRKRPDDIDAFTNFFIKKYAQANDVPALPVSDAALIRLKQHNWPGNVRELENTLHRAVLLSIGHSAIEPDAVVLSASSADSPPMSSPESTTATPSTGPLVGRSMASVEQELILGTLDHCLGNRTQAAKILGISIRTLRNKLNQYRETQLSEAAGGRK
ncbi:MAG: sigma-54-dependent Fis family transcriptional regulator [Hyphomicrobiales bacterium]|nr:sigma-54-dependent Fis family transcriptional regulator [Rickettsiales bacterium]MCP5361464.1 sigma-54-dependent Fis family transcriptional regulator [Hyphomicrobiales bacterium]